MPKISVFLSKTYALLSEPSPYYRWAHPGEPFSFIITQPIPFAAEVLPRHFKHNNFNSFARQLNLFGFRKGHSVPDGSTSRSRDGTTQPHPQTFSHPLFVAGHPELIEQIKKPRCVDGEESHETHDTHETQLAKENERLTRELERSEAQRQELQAYISQLLTIVAYNQDDGGAKRKRVSVLPIPPPPAALKEPRTPTSFKSVSPSPSSSPSEIWQVPSPASSVCSQSPMDLTGESDMFLPSADSLVSEQELLPVASWSEFLLPEPSMW
jgi:hypothetical protein